MTFIVFPSADGTLSYSKFQTQLTK